MSVLLLPQELRKALACCGAKWVKPLPAAMPGACMMRTRTHLSSLRGTHQPYTHPSAVPLTPPHTPVPPITPPPLLPLGMLPSAGPHQDGGLQDPGGGGEGRVGEATSAMERKRKRWGTPAARGRLSHTHTHTHQDPACLIGQVCIHSTAYAHSPGTVVGQVCNDGGPGVQKQKHP